MLKVRALVFTGIVVITLVSGIGIAQQAIHLTIGHAQANSP